MNKITKLEVEKAFVCPMCGGLKKVDEKECPICEGIGVVVKSSSSPKVGDSFVK